MVFVATLLKETEHVAYPRSPGGSCPGSIPSRGVTTAEGPAKFYRTGMAEFLRGRSSFLCEMGTALGAWCITAGGKYHAQRSPCPHSRQPQAPPPVGGTAAEPRGPGALPCPEAPGRSSCAGLGRGRGQGTVREGASQQELKTDMPHSSHKVAVHTKGPFMGPPGLHLGTSSSPKCGLTRWSCGNRVPSLAMGF